MAAAQPVQEIFKRLFDVVLSGTGLVVLFPLFVVVSLWVKLDSPGPVLFRQVRVGRHGVPFQILKFRTMVTEQSARGLQITVGRDPRITSSGHYLRKFKIDEIPQLLNVLRGDMSLVGPRPEVPKYVEDYPAEARALILSVRPGITDLASIEFRNESEILAESANPEQTYRNEILPRKLALSMEYVRRRSLLGDVGLILKTVLAVFAGEPCVSTLKE